MALLFYDGFDHYYSGSPVAVGKWGASTSLTPTIGVSAANARTGNGYLSLGASSYDLFSKPFPAASGGFIVGMAFYADSAFNGAANLLEIYEGASTLHFAVSIETGGFIRAKRATTTLDTSVLVVPTLTWVYIEVKGTIHDTTGSYEIRVDGTPHLSGSSQDTRNGGTGVWDRFRVRSPAASGRMDDVYLCDTSGPAPRNDFLGPVKVETLLPQTDAVAAGSNAGLTPSTGTDHGALVDEYPENTTDFNSGTTVGLKDTYNYPAPVLTGAVLGIQTGLYVSKSDAGARQVCAVVRTGGVDYDGANVSPGTTFQYVLEVRAQNPNTGVDWTTADITALQAGMKITA